MDTAILESFKKAEGRELTTSDVVKFIFPDEASVYAESVSHNAFFLGSEKGVTSKLRYQKAILHKRLLYHLNKLVNEGILKLSGIEEHGEKRFSLVENYGDIIIGDKKKTIVISNNFNPSTPIDGYEAKKIIKKFNSKTWISKLDAILLNANTFVNYQELHDSIIALFEEVGDSIAINHFETMIQDSTNGDLKNFIETICEEVNDYGKNINLLIDLEKVFDVDKIKIFIDTITKKIRKNILVIFQVTSSSLIENRNLILYLIQEYAEHHMKINIMNKSIHQSPVFVGRAGVYSFDEKEWRIFEKEYENKTKGVSCASSTLIVDLKEFFDTYASVHEFRKFIMKANKAFLIATNNKKKIAKHYFKTINKINKPFTREFYKIERSYLRFWNYSSKFFDEKSHFLTLMKNVAQETDKFTKNEEIIYKSCGIPSRFSIAFSSAFKHSDLTISPRIYKKSTISDINYFEIEEVKKYLKIREKFLKIFQGVDRIRFFRESPENNEDVLNEFVYITENLNFPLVTYDFSKISGNAKLTTFFKKSNKNKLKWK